MNILNCQGTEFFKRVLLVTFLSLLGAGLATPLFSQSLSSDSLMTLQGTVEYAMEHSPLLQSVRQGIISGKLDLDAAQSMRRPSLDIGASVQAASQPSETAIALSHSSVADLFTPQPSSFTHANVGAYLTQPLYLGGYIKAESDFAKAELGVAKETKQDVENNLVYNVTLLYVRLVEIEQYIPAVRRSVKALDESLANIKQMVELNKRPRVDLLKVETRLANVRAQLIELQNASQIQAGRLNALIGRPDETPFKVEKNIAQPLVEISLEKAVSSALNRNPNYLSMKYKVEAAKQQVSVAKSLLSPSISLTVGYQAQIGTYFIENYKNNAVAGVTASWSLFNRFLKKKVDLARSHTLERDADLDQLELDIGERVKTAYLEIQDAKARVEATDTAITSAREVLRIEQDKTRMGRGIVEQLLDAQAAYLTSVANYYKALADYRIAVAALERETTLTF